MEISDEVGLLGYFCNPTLKLGYWVTFVGLLTRLKLGYWVTKVGLLTPMLGYFGTKLQYRRELPNGQRMDRDRDKRRL